MLKITAHYFHSLIEWNLIPSQMLSGFQLLATIQNSLLELHAYHSKNIHMQIEVTCVSSTYWRNFFFVAGRRTSQAPHCSVIGQRRILLHGPFRSLRGSQFSQPQPLGNHPSLGQKRHMCGRAFGLFSHRNGAHSNHASKNGEFVCIWTATASQFEAKIPMTNSNMLRCNCVR